MIMKLKCFTGVKKVTYVQIALGQLLISLKLLLFFPVQHLKI